MILYAQIFGRLYRVSIHKLVSFLGQIVIEWLYIYIYVDFMYFLNITTYCSWNAHSKHLKSGHESFLHEAAAATCGIIAAMRALRGPPGHWVWANSYHTWPRYTKGQTRYKASRRKLRLPTLYIYISLSLSLSFSLSLYLLIQRLLGSSVCHS